jgi:S-DNA-T family DNA segregation ATPase FtsK/SpoIIIE
MASSVRIQTLRMCAVIAGLALCALAWVSLLTFDPHDWPSPAAWPSNEPTRNACGRAGSLLAYGLLHYLGEGAYPLVLFATVGAIARLARDAIADLPFRMIGVALLVSVTSVSVALVSPYSHRGLPEGNGGVLGIALLAGLQHYFSAAGTALILLCAFVVGVLLAADDLVLRVPGAYGWLRHRIAQLAAVIRWAAQPLRPALAAPGGVAIATDEPVQRSVDRPVTINPPRELVAGTLATREEEKPTKEPPREETSEHRPKPPEEPRAESLLSAVRELVIRTTGMQPAKGKPPTSPWPKELGDYVLPQLSLLRDPEYVRTAAHEALVRDQARVLEKTLQEFRIDARVVEIDTGPVITLFEVELAPGIKVGQISALSNDVARALKAPVVRVVPTLPGKNTIGIEVPNLDKEKVRLKELIMLGGTKPTKMALPVFLGKDASGNPLIADIAAMPHLLIAGTTGSGKSVCINSLIMSFLMTQRPDHVKLIMIDPKMVELSVFKDVPHLMCPIVHDMQQAELILDWATTKMDERYELLAEAGVKNIEAFNRLGKEEVYTRFQPTTDDERTKIPTHLPYIIVLIDALADLMMTSSKEVEHHLARLAQKSRAVGIHLIVATQRPQANVVTGLIKSNLPCRIAFRVASRMDSRIVLDQNGAELLMGQGDMLYLPPGSAKLIRSQGTFVEDDELKAVIDDLRGKAQPEFHHELIKLRPAADENAGERDPLFDQAVDIIVETRRGSVSLLQRRLEIGYSRASRLIDQMAAAGIVGEYKGSQAREVAVTKDEWERIKQQRNREIAEGGFAADAADEPGSVDE